jgi:enoyl-CoA hydratase/carnithine racemase
VITPTFARGLPPPPDGTPRHHKAGPRVSGSPAFFLRDKAGRPRHARFMFRLESSDGRARLILDRPEARNAIPASGWAALAERIEEAVESGARLLVVTGAGGSFCAGADLADFAAMRADPAAIARFREAMRDALDRLRALPIPTVALVEGPCYGAGVALAMASDLRMAAPDAIFAITPAKLGIT